MAHPSEHICPMMSKALDTRSTGYTVEYTHCTPSCMAFETRRTGIQIETARTQFRCAKLNSSWRDLDDGET